MVAMRGRAERSRNGNQQRDDDYDEENDPRGGGGEIMTRARSGASGALHSVIEGAQSVTQQIRETTGEVTGAVLDTILDEAERIYRKQKKPAMSRIASLSKMADRTAHALHAVKAEGVADYVEQAADQVGTLTEYLDDRSLSEILEDAGDIVQRNRAVAMGGMFVVGFAVARFLKASASREEAGAEGGAEGDGGEADEQHDDERGRERTPRKQKRRDR